LAIGTPEAAAWVQKAASSVVFEAFFTCAATWSYHPSESS
jgi:hypothetical protein